MRVVIIDDESKGRKTICNFIQKYADHLEVIGEADCVDDGVNLINETKPELVFLDIQMPDGTGFDLLGLVEWSQFRTIFVTAFDQYAVKAFRFSAVDYLLKPIDPEIFIAAVKKLEHQAAIIDPGQREILNSHPNDIQKIALHSEDGIHYIDIADVVRCESDGNYTHFHILPKKELIVSRTLKEFDELLADKGFIRVHKSHLVNRSHVQTFLKNDGGWLEMSDGTKVEVSRRRKDYLLTALSKS